MRVRCSALAIGGAVLAMGGLPAYATAPRTTPSSQAKPVLPPNPPPTQAATQQLPTSGAAPSATQATPGNAPLPAQGKPAPPNGPQPMSPAPERSAPGQPGAPAGLSSTPPSVPAPSAQAPAPGPEPYVYKPEGRRDPFVSLIAAGFDTRPAGKRVDGLGGLMVSEISLKGIVQSRDGYVAMIQGPEGKTFVVHANDRLFDGTIKSITPQMLLILQEVNDPLSLVKQREVRKILRAPDVK